MSPLRSSEATGDRGGHTQSLLYLHVSLGRPFRSSEATGDRGGHTQQLLGRQAFRSFRVTFAFRFVRLYRASLSSLLHISLGRPFRSSEATGDRGGHTQQLLGRQAFRSFRVTFAFRFVRHYKASRANSTWRVSYVSA